MFNKLPDRIFSPLAGKNRQIYECVLLDLIPDLFGEIDGNLVFPRREMIFATIEQTLSQFEKVEWQDEEGTEGDSVDKTLPTHHLIYKRLVDCGWLEEELEGYNKYVVMAPDVGVLLLTLKDISKSKKRSYGGTIVTILTNIDAVINNPDEFGYHGLTEAVRQTKDFVTHITQMVHGLRDLQKQLLSTRKPQEILQYFFDDFVERILIADYRTLHDKNNPFRYRAKIIERLQQIAFDAKLKAQLCSRYMEEHRIDEGEALKQLEHDIHYTVNVFRSIDEQIRKVDMFRSQLEIRVTETVRYIDKTQPGVRVRVASLLQNLGTKFSQEPSWFLAVDTQTRLSNQRPLCRASLRRPGRARKPQPPTPFKRTEINPEKRLANERIRTYLKRRRISPPAIDDYIQRQLGERAEISAEDCSVRTVEDYIAFSRIPFLGMIKGGYHYAAKYSIELLPELVETDMLTCRNFRLKRRK